MALAPVLAALLLSAAPGPTAPTPEVRDQVRALLGSIHGSVPPETFRALGPGVEEALADFARGDEFPSRRIRALEALAGLGGDRAEAVHREVAADRTAPSSVRRGAVRGLAKLVPPADAPGALTQLLESDPDPRIRATAAEALAARAPDGGCPKVRERVRREAEPERFGRALETCDRAAAKQARPPSK
jgi:HEAT repeat protein